MRAGSYGAERAVAMGLPRWLIFSLDDLLGVPAVARRRFHNFPCSSRRLPDGPGVASPIWLYAEGNERLGVAMVALVILIGFVIFCSWMMRLTAWFK